MTEPNTVNTKCPECENNPNYVRRIDGGNGDVIEDCCWTCKDKEKLSSHADTKDLKTYTFRDICEHEIPGINEDEGYESWEFVKLEDALAALILLRESRQETEYWKAKLKRNHDMGLIEVKEFNEDD